MVYSDALREAYALAPADEVVLHTLEIRHPSFIDAAGDPDSAWLVADHRDFAGTIEAEAPVKGGQVVNFVAFAFSMTLAQIDPSATPEIAVTIDNVSRELTEQFDRAVTETDPILICYRPYLASDPGGPQMNPPPVFELSDVHVGTLRVTARARIGVDLRGGFPRRRYDAASFPGLIGR